jgi:Uma2 family endonuclease
MTVALRAKPITAEDFETFDPDWRYDLIRGELVPMPPMPGYEHGKIVGRHAALAGHFVIHEDLGEVFGAETRFIIERAPDTTIAPDWAFIRKDRLPSPTPRGFVPLVPDIVLEVRSPTDRPKEVHAMVDLWLGSGVEVVWELNPATRVLTIHRPGQEPELVGENDTLTEEALLPGFSLPLRRLFA